MSRSDFEYVVVGSGAGGGTVAARLAEKGHRVLLLEAGGDPIHMQGGDPNPNYEGKNRLPDDYKVPVFHAFASENEAMKWDFFVRHYENDELQKRDPKYRETWDGKNVRGVLYPRAGCLGGCTAHNAMICVYPHNSDWDYIQHLTGDSSWSSENMRRYFQRMENCHHRFFLYRWLAKLGINPTRHGWKGWLRTEKAVPKSALGDKDLVKTILASVHEAFENVAEPLQRKAWALRGQADPNDWRLVREDSFGIRYPPLTQNNHERRANREYLLETTGKYPLEIRLNCLVTRVLFEGTRAVGVEYEEGEKLYRAHYRPSTEPTKELKTVRVSREVILAGGAFNTPQLLMLSGVGPRKHLEDHGIEVLVDLPGVGSNLQDRYEVGVVNRMNFPHWEVLKDAKFGPGDPQYEQWATKRKGVYTTNGAVLAVIKRSLPERPLPDLFVFALLGNFPGYYPGYSSLFAKNLNYLTWAVLKAHTNNTAGEVRLRSSDPRDTPYINFKYFEEGNDDSGDDVQSVVEGVKFVRQMTAPLKKKGLIAEEELPGDDRQTDEQLADFVKYHAWGHHASCTCPIGPRARNGVLDAEFRVHGTQNLRVVDASVFPKIPGFFIVSAIWMIGEKAADVIARDAT